MLDQACRNRQQIDKTQIAGECMTESNRIIGLPWKALLIFLLAGFASVTMPSAHAARAILAGGCFWCMESDFESLPGVTDVISGFTGGTAANPTYNGDHTGHYEAVEIAYDPEIVDYQDILDHFWVNVDPFDPSGQFCDKGPSYRAAIFVATPEEQRLAEQSKQQVIEEFSDQAVVMPILPVAKFYPIKGNESYHQDFYKKSPIRYKSYRWGCGRDRRLEAIWGDRVTH
jgi:peptide-methionine (S)-S-oxide reductase